MEGALTPEGLNPARKLPAGVGPWVAGGAIRFPQLDSPRPGPPRSAAAAHERVRRTWAYQPQEEATRSQSHRMDDGYR